MIFHSIRWRLQIWHGLILLLVLAGFGLTAYHVAQDNQARRTDQELGFRLMSMFRPLPLERGPGPPPGAPSEEGPRRFHGFEDSEFVDRLCEHVRQAGSFDSSQTNSFYYILWRADGSLLGRSPNAPSEVPVPENPRPPKFRDEPGRSPPPGPGGPAAPEPRNRGNVREIFRFLPHGECLLVGHIMTSDLAAMHRLVVWLTIAGAGVLVLGLAGGWWLSTRAIRPIDDISTTATKIAGGDLSQRINAADTDSELGRLAIVLNSTFARLEAAFANQARFTSDASHELRTPVSVVLSQTQTALSRERSAAEYREALEACQRAAQRMRGLTESLLALARLDAGQEPIQHEPFDLAQVVRESLELVRPLAEERKIEMSSLLTQTQCLGDPQRISQVATNLLTNAIHFNRDHGQVRISAQHENGAALLTVSDTGQGIPPEDLPHIFERFYRVEKSRSRIQGRNGLGLAISKAIVDAHGGTIEVLSEPGKGSTFTVRLPAR